MPGWFMHIDNLAMMIGVFNIIVIPVVAGLLAHSVLYNPRPWAWHVGKLTLVVLASVDLVIGAVIVSADLLGVIAPLRNGFILGGSLLAALALSKIIISVWPGRSNTWIDRVLPLLSMAGICIILAIIIAQTHDVLLEAGILLVLAAVIHNSVGYGFGYWGARGLGALLGQIGYRFGFSEISSSFIDKANCRTVAFKWECRTVLWPQALRWTS